MQVEGWAEFELNRESLVKLYLLQIIQKMSDKLRPLTLVPQLFWNKYNLPINAAITE